jgi:hypothetical protein
MGALKVDMIRSGERITDSAIAKHLGVSRKDIENAKTRGTLRKRKMVRDDETEQA